MQKKVVIARSGIYQYAREELDGLGLNSIPEEYATQELFNVYRPATVIGAAVDLFTKLPLTRDHKAWITPENFRDYAIGWTGDTAEAEQEGGEVLIRSTLNLIDAEGLEAYQEGVREVSPGYQAKFSWKDGKSPDGQDYCIVMDKVEEVNHLAFVDHGRGGKEVRITDSKPASKKEKNGLFEEASKIKGGKPMFLSALFRTAKKRVGVKDASPKRFKELVEKIVKDRAKLSDEELTRYVGDMEALSADLPETDGKGLLGRYLSDIKHIKDADGETAKAAGKMVADLYDNLNKQADAEAEMKGGEDKPEEKAHEKPEEKELKDGVEGQINPEETGKAKDEEGEEGEEPDAEKAKEVLGFLIANFDKIKALLEVETSEHGAGETGDEDKKDEEKKEDSKVGDKSPFTHSLSSSKAATSTLADLDKAISNGRKK